MSTFLFEVGTEELPASFVQQALKQWQDLIPATLTEQFLVPESIEVYATPRRLATLIEGLPSRQADREEEIKGPPATAAFKDGKPTPAAIGFAKKQGVPVESLEIRPTDKGEFVFVQKQISGQPTADILAAIAPQWITQLEGSRFMRWGDGDLRFPRPIRWLVALLDKEILPITLVNGSETIASDRISWGHRVLSGKPVKISQASSYVKSLRSAYVEVDPERRKARIQEQVKGIAAEVSGVAEIASDLLAEVTHLVEWPTAVMGKFDSEFLQLPAAVIKTVMVTHQRYFPVLANSETTSVDHQLLPYFITISNGDINKSQIIATGNERVIRARLADGQFFYKADLAKSLESYLPQLATVTFQEDLGSMRDKVDRIIEISALITDQLEKGGQRISSQDRTYIQRAALLCKADLVSLMVYEFPELQGIMGEKYATAAGEPEGVAKAISSHYLPKGAGDQLPEILTGQVVGLADRLDTLVGIFGLGLLPTGSSDPFALRRAANAVINITWSAELPINLYQLLEQLTANFQRDRQGVPGLFEQLCDFFLQRIRTLLQDEQGVDYDLVNAVLGDNDLEYTQRALQDLLDTRDRAKFLQTIRQNEHLNDIYETVNRSTRLAAQGDLDKTSLDPAPLINPQLFQQPSEQVFYQGLVALVPQTQAAQQNRNYQQLVTALAEIAPTVSEFFDGPQSVLVMDSDPAIRQNRLNLLGILRNHARVLADFGQIVKS